MDSRAYQTLSPPDYYNDPISMDSIHKRFEPHINLMNSSLYLLEYPTFCKAMEKAKRYWLSFNAYEDFNQFYEELRKQVPSEVEHIRVEMWKRHVLIVEEDDFNLGYHRVVKLDINENRYKHFFSKHLCVNRANKDLLEPLEIPSSFQTLEDYINIEPDDKDIIKQRLEKFPEIDEDIKQAKNYWLQKVSIEEAQSMQTEYSVPIQKFRELLWKRHVMLEGKREFNKKVARQLVLEAAEKENLKNSLAFREKLKKLFRLIGMVVAVVATVFFFLKYISNLFSKTAIRRVTTIIGK